MGAILSPARNGDGTGPPPQKHPGRIFFLRRPGEFPWPDPFPRSTPRHGKISGIHRFHPHRFRQAILREARAKRGGGGRRPPENSWRGQVRARIAENRRRAQPRSVGRTAGPATSRIENTRGRSRETFESDEMAFEAPVHRESCRFNGDGRTPSSKPGAIRCPPDQGALHPRIPPKITARRKDPKVWRNEMADLFFLLSREGFGLFLHHHAQWSTTMLHADDVHISDRMKKKKLCVLVIGKCETAKEKIGMLVGPILDLEVPAASRGGGGSAAGGARETARPAAAYMSASSKRMRL